MDPKYQVQAEEKNTTCPYSRHVSMLTKASVTLYAEKSGKEWERVLTMLAGSFSQPP